MLDNYVEAVKKIQDSIKEILESIFEANKIFLSAAVDECNEDEFDKAREKLKNISSKVDDIDNSIIKVLALYSPEAKDLREVVAYFKIDNELLRAASNSRSLIRGFKDNCSLIDKEIITEYLMPLQTSTLKALKMVLQMIDSDDIDELKDIYHLMIVEEDKTDELYSMLEEKIIQKIKAGDDFAKIHKMLRAFRRSEKIADRTISIANLLLYIQDGGRLRR